MPAPAVRRVRRDRSARRERDAGLDGLEAGGRDFLGMVGDGNPQQAKPALLAERRVVGDDRAIDSEPGHVVGDDLFRFRQRAGQ